MASKFHVVTGNGPVDVMEAGYTEKELPPRLLSELEVDMAYPTILGVRPTNGRVLPSPLRVHQGLSKSRGEAVEDALYRGPWGVVGWTQFAPVTRCGLISQNYVDVA